ncbi:hypothetical protein M3Y97_00648100 [Aphelenchoides bicaudatus]|nr:hypothetical protein M3Y97_00648100 [Aphelenchoides bicaudatus]
MFRLLIATFALVTTAHALKCYDGAQSDGFIHLSCEEETDYCVLWSDYTFNDFYGFCDSTKLCQGAGYSNFTAYGITCCREDLCNAVPAVQSQPETPVVNQQPANPVNNDAFRPVNSVNSANNEPVYASAQDPTLDGNFPLSETTSDPLEKTTDFWEFFREKFLELERVNAISY